MAPRVFKLLTIALLLSTVHAGYKRIRKKIIIYVPEVTKVIHHKHVAKVVVPQIIYKDFKPNKEHGVGLEGGYGSYDFEHVGKGYGGVEHGGAVYSTLDFGGKGFAGSEPYGGYSHDFQGSASSYSAALGGHGGSRGAAAPHGSNWRGGAGGGAYSALHPQYTQHRQVVVRYGQPPAHNGWAAATGEATVRRQAARSAASAAGGVGGGGGGGGGWVSVGGVEVARGRDVLAGA